MSGYLGDLIAELRRRKLEPVTGADFLNALNAIGQMIEATANDRKLLNQLEARLLLVDDLPSEAPFGALIRRRTGTVAQQATLYMGNGAGQPLSRIVPQAL